MGKKKSHPEFENKNYNYHNSLANVLKEQGKFLEAIIFYKKAIEINPDNLEAYLNYAAALKSLNELDKALQLLKKVISLNPSKITKLVAFNNLGNIYWKKRDSLNAFENYKNALNIDSKYILTLYNIGLLYDYDATLSGRPGNPVGEIKMKGEKKVVEFKKN